jgi:hypothetical protein
LPPNCRQLLAGHGLDRVCDGRRPPRAASRTRVAVRASEPRLARSARRAGRNDETPTRPTLVRGRLGQTRTRPLAKLRIGAVRPPYASAPVTRSRPRCRSMSARLSASVSPSRRLHPYAITAGPSARLGRSALTALATSGLAVTSLSMTRWTSPGRRERIFSLSTTGTTWSQSTCSYLVAVRGDSRSASSTAW